MSKTGNGVSERAMQLQSEWAEWAVRANERSEWPSGRFKTRLSETRNALLLFNVYLDIAESFLSAKMSFFARSWNRRTFGTKMSFRTNSRRRVGKTHANLVWNEHFFEIDNLIVDIHFQMRPRISLKEVMSVHHAHKYYFFNIYSMIHSFKKEVQSQQHS